MTGRVVVLAWLFLSLACAPKSLPMPQDALPQLPLSLERSHDPSREIDFVINTLAFCPPKGCDARESAFECPEFSLLGEPRLDLTQAGFGFEIYRVTCQESYTHVTRVATFVRAGHTLTRRDGTVQDGILLSTKTSVLPIERCERIQERVRWIDFWNLTSNNPSLGEEVWYGWPETYTLEVRCVGGYHAVSRSGHKTALQQLCWDLLEGALGEP